MVKQRFKGGEFNATCTFGYSAVSTKWSNSSVRQLSRVVEGFSMLVGVAARILLDPGILFAPELPRGALDSLVMDISMFPIYTYRENEI